MNCQMAVLAQEALLVIEGPDARKFLQGQITCDTNLVNRGKAQLGAYCTPQGRVVCDFLLVQLGEDCFGLRMRRDIVERAAATFGKYIVFSKAEVDLKHDWQLVALWGKGAAALLEHEAGNIPGAELDCAVLGECALVQRDDAGERFELFVPASEAGRLESLAQRVASAPEASWQALEITSGIGRVEAANLEEFVPQTLNYDLTGHISFSKGCYTGQEVVARLHYRGKPKRRTFLCLAQQGAAAGCDVFGSDGESSIGHVVNCAQQADGSFLLLVAATIQGAAAGLHLEGPQGPRLGLQELPYAIPLD